MRVPSLSGVARVAGISGTPSAALVLNPDGGLIDVFVEVGPMDLSSPSPVRLIPDQWHVITCRADVTRVTCRVDDGPDFSSQGPTMMPGAFLLGSTTGAPPVFWDDVAISDSPADYPIGDGETIALQPNAEGAHNQPMQFSWRAVDGGTGALASGGSTFALLDDWPAVGGEDFIVQTMIGTSAYAEYELADVPDQRSPTAIRVLFAHQTGTATGGLFSVKLLAGGLDDVYSGTRSDSLQYYGKTYPEDVSAIAWSRSVINAAKVRFGYSSAMNQTRLEALRIEAELPR